MLSTEEMETLLKNVDRRTSRLEQILPTLATKEDLAAGIAAGIAPLATKAELAAAIAPLATKTELAAAIAPLATKAELAAAVAPLATKTELAAAIAPLATKEGLAEVRRHALILNEAVRDDIRMLAEHVAGLIDPRSGNH